MLQDLLERSRAARRGTTAESISTSMPTPMAREDQRASEAMDEDKVVIALVVGPDSTAVDTVEGAADAWVDVASTLTGEPKAEASWPQPAAFAGDS